MLDQVIDINKRLEVCIELNGIDSLFVAADIFGLSRQQERELCRLVFSGESLRPAVIAVADIPDDMGIDWDSAAGQWVNDKCAGMLSEADGYEQCRHSREWLFERYLLWFAEEGAGVLA